MAQFPFKADLVANYRTAFPGTPIEPGYQSNSDEKFVFLPNSWCPAGAKIDTLPMEFL
jgi:hypothetical protein